MFLFIFSLKPSLADIHSITCFNEVVHPVHASQRRVFLISIFVLLLPLFKHTFAQHLVSMEQPPLELLQCLAGLTREDDVGQPTTAVGVQHVGPHVTRVVQAASQRWQPHL